MKDEDSNADAGLWAWEEPQGGRYAALQPCQECGLADMDGHKMSCSRRGAEEEPDFLEGKTCNPDEPEECESCQ